MHLAPHGAITHRMSNTIRRQTIKFTAPQYTWLVAEAEKLGISLADLVRRIIDQHREAS